MQNRTVKITVRSSALFFPQHIRYAAEIDSVKLAENTADQPRDAGGLCYLAERTLGKLLFAALGLAYVRGGDAVDLLRELLLGEACAGARLFYKGAYLVRHGMFPRPYYQNSVLSTPKYFSAKSTLSTRKVLPRR